MEIKILLWKKITGDSGLVKALVDIETVDGWTLRALRLMHHPGRKAYVTTSRCGIRDPDTGHLTFEQIVYAPHDVWKAIEEAIINQYEREVMNGTNDSTKN